MIADDGDFYVTGGTVGLESHCYVSRKADAELFEALSRGDFCYVLTSRQMGKSSLSVRVAARLREAGTLVARLDLTAIGQNLTPEQWYDGLLVQLGGELDLEDELEEFWRSNIHLSPLMRWMSAIREIVLERCPGPVVLFVDEIDYVRSLPFSTDEFFAAIREFYNRRTDDPAMHRLAVCLLGVATPSDLIQDTRTTPFNIGRRVELADFSPAEATPLAAGFGCDTATASRLLARILYWTHGHPYLTQRLCQAVAADPSARDESGVDRRCDVLFLSGRARERDDNLLFVRERLLRVAEPTRARLLGLYARVHRDGRVADEESDPLVELLRLSGITRVVSGRLQVRNRIYRRVFDRRWARSNRPKSYRRAFYRGAAIATLASLLVVGAGGGYATWWWYAYHKTSVEYYNTHIKRNGVYVGVGPISPEQQRHRPVTYKFFKTGWYGLVTKVQAVSAAGELTYQHVGGLYLDTGGEATAEDDPNRWSCQWEFVRDGVGRVISEIGRDRAGRQTWAFTYTPANSGATLAHFVNSRGFPQSLSGSLADYVRIVRNNAGDEVDVRFYDKEGKHEKNHAGIHGFTAQFDDRGLPEEITYLGLDGKPRANALGIVKERRAFDPRLGNLKEEAFYDAMGRPAICDLGYFRASCDYDEAGNVRRIEYWDIDGTPAFHNRDGYAKVDLRRDVSGRIDTIAYLDGSGRPLRVKDGYATVSFRFDRFGNEVERTFRDQAGLPTRSLEGIASIRHLHNDRGLTTETSFFDERGGPTPNAEGIARFTSDYDERGHVKERLLFDEAGRPARHRGEGHYGWRYTYNSRGQERELVLLGADRQPARGDENYARRIMTYNDKGLLVEQLYFDEKGEPTLHRQENHGWRSRYNDRGLEVERTYLSIDGRAARTLSGIAGWFAEYDDRGRQVALQYIDEGGKGVRMIESRTEDGPEVDDRSAVLDAGKDGFEDAPASAPATRGEGRDFGKVVRYAAGKPARLNDGYSRVKRQFNDRDQPISEDYFDETGERARHKDGYQGYTNSYDDRHRLAEAEFWGYDHADGFARVKIKFDDRARGIEKLWFGADGKPARNKDGYQRLSKTYDSHGVVAEESYWGYDGVKGYFRMRTAFKDTGKSSDSTFFNETGKPVWHADGFFRLSRRLDERGNALERAFFDAAGNPKKCNDNYARIIAKYDDRDRPTEFDFLDEVGRPTRHREGAAHVSRSYNNANHTVMELHSGFDRAVVGHSRLSLVRDARGNVLRQIYLDAAGKPTKNREGYARGEAKYDARGNLVEVRYYDEAGMDARLAEGHTGFASTYDASSRLVAQEYWGYNAATMNFARMAIRYDAQGKIADAAYFDDDGNPARHRDGNAGYTNAYDAQGRLAEQVQWGYAAGEGYERIRFRYDAKGNILETAYLDDHGKPARHRDGYAGFTNTYDESGKLVADLLWGYDGSEGYVVKSRRLDTRGNVLEVAFLDDHGKLARHRDGYAGFTNTYDESGKLVADLLWGYDGSEGYARQSRRLDARGEPIEIVFLDDRGKPATHVEGYARKSISYNAKGNVLEVAFLDDHGKPTRHRYGNTGFTNSYNEDGKLVTKELRGFDVAVTGHARRVVTYDGQGRVAKVDYLGSDGKPTRHEDGYAGFTNTYDESGKLVADLLWGYDGSWGYTKQTRRFNARGEAVEIVYRDDAGKPVSSLLGYSRIVQEWDAAGKIVAANHYDMDGSLVATKDRIVFTEILPGGEAEKKHLQVGDVLLSYNGDDFTEIKSFIQAVLAPGQKQRELRVHRKGEVLTMSVAPGHLNAQFKVLVLKAVPEAKDDAKEGHADGGH